MKIISGSIILRLLTVTTLTIFVSIRNNPIVRLEAVLGLSPSPIEKLFGIKSLFSGMTEGMYRLAHGNIVGSMEANVLTPFFALILLLLVTIGYRPRITTKFQEKVLLVSAIILTLSVNYFNP